jgi:Icc-related predicted phosphoesterase
MKFITLTNATPTHAGEKISLRADMIYTVYSKQISRDDDTLEQVTFIHCPPHGTWEVQEPMKTVLKLLENA